MKVDHILILAAGKGTRMGEIGKEVPKVIWPIFRKSLLELQVEYAKRLAPSASIHINLFNYKDKLIEFCRQKKLHESVELVVEEKILDIGGAVHNVASRLNYQGNLLILNSDQFLFFDQLVFKQALIKLEEFDGLLFTYKVNSNEGYNALKSTQEKLVGVIPNSELASNQQIETYTGMSLIKLDQLKPTSGESKFFDSVASVNDNKVGTMLISDVEYWDFGTLQRFRHSILNILTKTESLFVQFLKEAEAIDHALLASKRDHNEVIQVGDFKMHSDKIVYGNKVSYF